MYGQKKCHRFVVLDNYNKKRLQEPCQTHSLRWQHRGGDCLERKSLLADLGVVAKSDEIWQKQLSRCSHWYSNWGYVVEVT